MRRAVCALEHPCAHVRLPGEIQRGSGPLFFFTARARFGATLGAEQITRVLRPKLLRVSAGSNRLTDFRVVLHDHLSASYEVSRVLLATAGFDGTLQLLTSAWEDMLGYGRDEFKGKRLSELMWFSARHAAAAVAAILDTLDMRPLDLRLRCRNGRGKSLTLHRRYDAHEHMMYIVAVETPAQRRPPENAERRASAREP
jgi:PAS domain-containing protein